MAAEWQSVRSYDARTTNIRGDAGATNSLAHRFSTATVLDDRQTDDVDLLTGSAGQDWFWADRTADNRRRAKNTSRSCTDGLT